MFVPSGAVYEHMSPLEFLVNTKVGKYIFRDVWLGMQDTFHPNPERKEKIGFNDDGFCGVIKSGSVVIFELKLEIEAFPKTDSKFMEDVGQILTTKMLKYPNKRMPVDCHFVIEAGVLYIKRN